MERMQDRRPRLGHGFRFQWEPAQNCHVLLYPEGMVKLNQSAGEILRRCNGETTVGELVADLEQAFSASGLLLEVTHFLNHALQQRWVEWTEGES
ncbi:MAG TPA: pyrroloquinoline quinone biosynthesis peptide chaperone PqqD [Rhodocyclaceae bacterium]|nr:pyrroloquinoline quinone biosynthesis peptide chaperone PqqD [Rhodocyclaceae bacterium]